MTKKANGQRKRRYYDKLPARDESLPPAFCANPNQPPPWFTTVLGGTAEKWRGFVAALNKKATEDWFRRLGGVYEHFGITISAPGAHKDLALSLAFRHERDLLVQGKRVCYAALCERYGVDPDQEGSDAALAVTLFDKYVDGEHSPRWRVRDYSDDWGTRFSSEELAELMIAVISVEDHLCRNGDRASVHAIAACLRDKKRLASIIPKTDADIVHAIFLRRGNKSQDTPKPLGDTRLRQLIGEIRTARTVLRSGRQLTPVQVQLFLGALPDPLIRSCLVRMGPAKTAAKRQVICPAD